jgi:hypothetical protein
MGKPFAAVLRLNPENVVEFDFGPNQKDGEGGPAEVDFTGMAAFGQMSSCQSMCLNCPCNMFVRRRLGRFGRASFGVEG